MYFLIHFTIQSLYVSKNLENGWGKKSGKKVSYTIIIAPNEIKKSTKYLTPFMNDPLLFLSLDSDLVLVYLHNRFSVTNSILSLC